VEAIPEEEPVAIIREDLVEVAGSAPINGLLERRRVSL